MVLAITDDHCQGLLLYKGLHDANSLIYCPFMVYLLEYFF